MRHRPGYGYPATRHVDADTVVLPKLPPDSTWLVTPESYRPVGVPENRSSIPGVVDIPGTWMETEGHGTPDWGLRLLLTVIALALAANAVTLLLLWQALK